MVYEAERRKQKLPEKHPLVTPFVSFYKLLPTVLEPVQVPLIKTPISNKWLKRGSMQVKSGRDSSKLLIFISLFLPFYHCELLYFLQSLTTLVFPSFFVFILLFPLLMMDLHYICLACVFNDFFFHNQDKRYGKKI